MKLPSRKARRERAEKIWLRFQKDYEAGMRVTDIAKKYINPVTGKPYTTKHVYWAFNQLKKDYGAN